MDVCEYMLYESATTTLTGNGNVIVARPKSFLGCVKNKDTGFSERLFDRCANASLIQPHKWLNEGTRLLYLTHRKHLIVQREN